MKSNAQMLIVLVCLTMMGATPLTGAADVSYANQVLGKRVFPLPFSWVGNQTPSETESAALLDAANTFATGGVREGMAVLENFLQTYPHSTWAPSVHLGMGQFYQGQLRFSRALTHFEAAWNKTCASPDDAGKEAAVQAADSWGYLLGCLGKVEELERLLGMLDTLNLPTGSHYDSLLKTRAQLHAMKVQPSIVSGCGLGALNRLAKNEKVDSKLKRVLLQIHVPSAGFSVADLTSVARTNGISLQALRRSGRAPLPLPCIVHFKAGHYATFTEQRGDLYRVEDPTFGGGLWMEADAMEEEASGAFLVVSEKAPDNWARIDDKEAEAIRGKGLAPRINDENDTPEDDCGSDDEEEDAECDPPAANDGPAADGSDFPPPPPCCGMPQWRVSEPYINLWLHDTPLLYRLSNGKWMQFKISYKSRSTGEARSAISGGFGEGWSCNFISKIQGNTNLATRDYYTNHVAGGGLRRYMLNADPDYWVSRVLRMKPRPGGGVPIPAFRGPTDAEREHAMWETYASGATDYFLTKKADRYGRTVLINYEKATVYTTNVVRPTTIVDLDGRTSTISYSDPRFPRLITSIEDPYHRKAYFIYDHKARLTNIVDALSITNVFQYDDAQDKLVKMITPYGETSFSYAEDTSSQNRALRVTEANGQCQLFGYVVGDPLFGWRQSFHWNRAQYAAISPAGKANILQLPEEDYQKATLKKWLHQDAGGYENSTVSGTLQWTAPAFDSMSRRSGSVAFEYPDQTDPSGNYPMEYIGRSRKPSRIAPIDGASGDPEIRITRNSLGRPTTIAYRYNGSADLFATYINTYDSSGRYLQSQTGPNGETVRTYDYHPVITNLLVAVHDALGQVTRYTHDTSTLKVTGITFPGGLVRSNIYYASGPSQGFLKQQVDYNGTVPLRTNSFVYENGNVVVHTNEMGLALTNTWDALNRLVATRYPDGTIVSNLYNKLDLAATKDRLGAWTKYTYDAVRQLIGVTNSENAVTIYDYCGCGSPSLIIQSNGTRGLITSHTYDMAGRLTNTIYPDTYQVTRTYGANGMLERLSDNGGRSLSVAYDSLGLRRLLKTVSMTDGSFTLLTAEYDEYGRLTNHVDQNGIVTTNDYDRLGRLLRRQVVADGIGAERFEYDARGLTNYFDGNGHLATYVRDEAGRILYQTNANHELLQFTYYPGNQLKALIDGKGSQTAWRLDAYGQVAGKSLLGQDVLRYYYNAEGRLTNRWSLGKGGSGYNTYYAYDGVGNLTNISYPTLTNRYQYDALSRLTNMVDPGGSSAFTWTDGGQLSTESGRWASDKVTVSYLARLRNGLNVQRPTGGDWIQSYGYYDGSARLQNITSPAGSFEYWYQGYDLISHISRQAGANDERTYDYGLLREAKFSSGTRQDEHSYAYDAGMQRTQHVYYVAGAVSNTNVYTYDDIGQLIGAHGFEVNGTPRLNEQFGYAYDAAGNLNWRTNNNLKVQLGVNGLNQLTTVSRSGAMTVAGSLGQPSDTATVNVSGTGLPSTAADVYGDSTWAARSGAALADGLNSYTATVTENGQSSQQTVSAFLPATISFKYDGNGNLTNDGLRSFEYDFENQLTNIQVSGVWRSEFQYDGLGRRRVRREYTWKSSNWSLGNEVRYVYDGRVVVQERDGSNNPQVTYTRGIDLSGSLQGAGGIGGLLARNDSSGDAYYHCDGNGNVTCMIDASGNVVARYTYDPFGNVIAMSGSKAAANLYRFSSKEVHPNSGLVYYLYRYYDPNLQRWINRDPIAEEGGINLGGFVSNDPINFVDFFGLTDFYPPDFIGPIPSGGVPCPEAPKGVSLYQNTATAESLGFRSPSAPSRREEGGFGLGNSLAKASWFYNQVKQDGPWDFKQQDPKYEDFGNFNYGATGAAYGFSDWELQNEAGIAQQKNPKTRGAGRGTPGKRWNPGSGIPPFGDEPKDNQWIKYGIEYNKKYPASGGAGPCG